MKTTERQQAIERYSKRIQQLGPVVQALGWRNHEQQQLRFKIIAEGLPQLEGASILDIGCGFGDLYNYLAPQVTPEKYIGCDISSEVLHVARTRYPDVRFDLRDVLEMPYPEQSIDYVCISGIFNHRIDDNENFLKQMLKTAYRICKRGLAVNMTTNQVDFRDETLYYFSPESVLRFSRTLSKRVAIRQDYPLYEFTAFIYRESSTQ
jgi:ubiquinone/menaquinone biosynthesis C-methylase UbiE